MLSRWELQLDFTPQDRRETMAPRRLATLLPQQLLQAWHDDPPSLGCISRTFDPVRCYPARRVFASDKVTRRWHTMSVAIAVTVIGD